MICKQTEEMFDTLLRSRNATRESKAASALVQNEEMVTIPMREYKDLQDKKCANIISQTIRQSKAASVIENGINHAAIIEDFLNKRY